jgi:hypothetical protein
MTRSPCFDPGDIRRATEVVLVLRSRRFRSRQILPENGCDPLQCPVDLISGDDKWWRDTDRLLMGILGEDPPAPQRLAVATRSAGFRVSSTASISPRPRTSRMILERMLLRPSRKRAPCTAAFSTIPSSTSTRSAARATAQASGLPPKVEPCWPGLRVPSTALFERTADTG